MPPTKSNVWKFFVKTKSGGNCKLCQVDVKTSGNTTNLTKHLIRRHPKTLLESHMRSSDEQHTEEASTSTSTSSTVTLEPESDLETESEAEVDTPAEALTLAVSSRAPARQPLITEAVARVKSFSEGGSKAAEITNAIIYMIAKDNLPINTTEHEGFRFFLNVVAPLYKPPSHKTISNMIDQKYEVLSGIFQEILTAVSDITLTVDVWTETMQTVSFLGVTAHFFHNKKLNTVSLCVKELDSRHTSKYLQDCISEICARWNIPSVKVTAVVSDNGINIVKATQDLFGKNKHLPCFAHTLDLVASNIIKDVELVQQIVDKVKSIVTFFRQSVNLADELRKAQTSSSNKNYKLIQAVSTRWNSCFYMLERFVQLSSFIAPILLKHPNSSQMVDATELQIIKEIIEILGPIEAVSKEISGDQYLTCSKIIPIIKCLTHKLRELSPSSEHAKALKERTLKDMSKRFGAAEQVNLLAVATILDPRFKKIHYNNAIACASAINTIDRASKEKMAEHNTSQMVQRLPSSNVEPQSSNSVWSFHESLALQSEANQTGPEDDTELFADLKAYLNQPIVPLKTDVLEYWNNCNSAVLKEIALKYLSVVGTSVPCERLFSQAGNIMSPKRNKLSGEKLSKLLFLRSLELKDWNM